MSVNPMMDDRTFDLLRRVRQLEHRVRQLASGQGGVVPANRYSEVRRIKEVSAEEAAMMAAAAVPQGFWARLTGEAGNGYYSWTMLQDDGETPVVPPVTGTGNAKEVNETPGIKTGESDGEVVWMWPDKTDEPEEYRFAYELGVTGFWARITGEGGAGGRYSWLALQRDGETPAEPEVAGLADEVNGVEGIQPDTVVWVWPVPGSDPPGFQFCWLHLGPWTTDPMMNSQEVVVDVAGPVPCPVLVWYRTHQWDRRGHTVDYGQDRQEWRQVEET